MDDIDGAEDEIDWEILIMNWEGFIMGSDGHQFGLQVESGGDIINGEDDMFQEIIK